jgi:hypothetical protein
MSMSATKATVKPSPLPISQGILPIVQDRAPLDVLGCALGSWTGTVAP